MGGPAIPALCRLPCSRRTRALAHSAPPSSELRQLRATRAPTVQCAVQRHVSLDCVPRQPLLLRRNARSSTRPTPRRRTPTSRLATPDRCGHALFAAACGWQKAVPRLNGRHSTDVWNQQAQCQPCSVHAAVNGSALAVGTPTTCTHAPEVSAKLHHVCRRPHSQGTVSRGRHFDPIGEALQRCDCAGSMLLEGGKRRRSWFGNATQPPTAHPHRTSKREGSGKARPMRPNFEQCLLHRARHPRHGSEPQAQPEDVGATVRVAACCGELVRLPRLAMLTR